MAPFLRVSAARVYWPRPGSQLAPAAAAMAYPIRQFDPQTIFFITSRTIQSRFLMAPSDKTNELIGGILARAVRQC